MKEKREREWVSHSTVLLCCRPSHYGIQAMLMFSRSWRNLITLFGDQRDLIVTGQGRNWKRRDSGYMLGGNLSQWGWWGPGTAVHRSCGAPSLEVLQARLDVALGSLNWWEVPVAGGWKWMGCEVPPNPNHSTILWNSFIPDFSWRPDVLQLMPDSRTTATRALQLCSPRLPCSREPSSAGLWE